MRYLAIALLLLLAACGSAVRACGDDCPPMPTPKPTTCEYKYTFGWVYYPKTEYKYGYFLVCE